MESIKIYAAIYLSRRQLVFVSKVNSDVSKVFTVVPQGSVIGPLVFLSTSMAWADYLNYLIIFIS